MSVHRDFNKANEAYVANFGDKGRLALAPTKKLAIVTCMDARINPYAHLGINEGEAHIIRNAGGVAKDALRSIIISQRLLGTREIAVFHHTGCGMLTFTSSHLQTLVKDSDPGNPALEAVDKIDFLEFPDLEQSIKDDVAFLKENPLVLPETVVTGWVYEVETGKVCPVQNLWGRLCVTHLRCSDSPNCLICIWKTVRSILLSFIDETCHSHIGSLRHM
ncbi:hypothetical protein CERSUDRAFT_41471 [Gelatoporia subvermispora B]|uniref:Carbonic anhydrase n=1 Tax=Ceriporiopsis subvermispora (strain B) TaxID=914234 RepID=M2RAU9_CERS8|nr:hypothetical protein CERSUDRAFT_41471 [Gelatoporia subvermispora B]